MKLGDIARVTGGILEAGDAGTVIAPAHISTDTRSLRRGSLFIAITGPRFDGNAFVAEAFRKGACGAVTSRAVSAPPGKAVIRVPDTVKALQDIAAFHRSTFRIPVIAVTGSNGKTTVKDMIWTVLSEQRTVLRNAGTHNNHIGVPQTLLRLAPCHEACVLELGTNHPGEIRLLGRIARPTMAVMTNIGPSHLAFLGDLAGVFREKRQVLASVIAGPGPAAVVNGDDPFLARLARGKRAVRTYGFGRDNDLAAAITGVRRGRIAFRVNGAAAFEVGLLGEHNVLNALAAIAVGRALGMRDTLIRRALASFRPTKMRLALTAVGGIHVINDAYNSNPLSMDRAIDVVRGFPALSRWIVSGDMLELGPCGEMFHRKIGERIAACGMSGLITFGELSRHTHAGAADAGMRREALWHCADHDEIAAVLRRVARKGDVVLLKGSRSMRMEEVLMKLKGRAPKVRGQK